MPAETGVNLIENKLKQFRVKFINIFAITTDAASVIKKLARLLEVYHQLCFAHEIQLAVFDVLYKTRSDLESRK